MVDRLIFVSHFIEDVVLDRIPAAARVPRWIIPNTIEDNSQSTDSELTHDLITIGTIEPRKNHEFLVRVIAAAHRLGFKYRLRIVGDGVHKSKLVELSSALGVREYITFAGSLPNAKSLISSHKAYVHGAIMENCPIVLLEA